jgi:hypothetical protein
VRDRQLRAASAVGARTREVAHGLRSIHAYSGHNLYMIWQDWISAMALALANAVDRRPDKLEAREAEYMQIVKAHGAKTMLEFKRLFGLVVAELEVQRTDVLGEMLMALELGNDHAGQYFTPSSVCEMLAQITLSAGEAREIVAKKGYIAVHEPAIGGGAMIYPMVDILLEAGLNPSEHLHVTGVDIDPHVLRIAYIQLSLLGVPAVLYVGDTLRGTVRDDYYTFAHIANGWGPRLRLQDELGVTRELLDELGVTDGGSAPAGSPGASPQADEPERAAAQALQLDLFGE